MIKKLPLIALAIIPAFTVKAQTITGTDVNPAIGHTSTVYQGAHVDEGASGTNQTWDLSGISSTATQARSYTAATAGYPGTNRTFTQTTGGQTVTIYMNHSNSGQETFVIDAAGTIITYSNPAYQLILPAVYNATTSDAFAATFTSGVQFTRSGTTTQVVDGTGTLITPEGTFSNVVRVHLHQVYTDVSSFGTINYDVHVYAWYKAGFQDELASVSTLDSDVTNTEYATYLEATGLGLTENEIGSLSVFPNPANTSLGITLSEEAVESIFVTDVQGKMHACDFSQNGKTAVLNTSELSDGIYFVRVNYASGKADQAKVMVN